MSIIVENLTKKYGEQKAVNDISFKIETGEVVGFLGPNGAGKTSLLNCISGFYHPTRGNISYGEKELTHAQPHQISNWGIARAFQNIELFGGLSVLDNLLLARHQKLNYNFLQAVFYFGKASRIEAENRAFVEDVIDFMELEAYRHSTVGNLSYGVQKRVEVARALTLAPNILLLDEPTNDLDVNTLRALEEALENFAGCAVVISHDRWFLDRIATHILAFEGDSNVIWFEGNYSDYENDKKARLGENSIIPKRIKYRHLTRD